MNKVYIISFMGGIKLENGVSGEICGIDADALIRIRVPEGASVLCTKDTVVFADATMDQVVQAVDVCGQPVWALTSTKGESQAYLAPQYGEITVALKADGGEKERQSFILYHSRSLVAMSDMCASWVDDIMPVEGREGSTYHVSECFSLSGPGVALVAGHGSVVKVVMETSEKSLVCDPGHLLAVTSTTKREAVVHLDDEKGRPSKVKLTGPGVAYLQSKVKP